MHVMFYSPMAKPDATAASGTQRMGHLLVRAIEGAGATVTLPDLPRCYDGQGDSGKQNALKTEAERATAALLAAIREGRTPKPDLWFSYHVYYKSPDWIGPAVSRALGIPYAIAEGSHAPKRAGGPWAIGHAQTTAAINAAQLLLSMTAFDRFCLDQIAPGRVRDLKPFIEGVGFVPGSIPGLEPRFVTLAMMRNERKRASYALLAAALQRVKSGLTLTIMGDGPYRTEIEAMFAPAKARHDIGFLGAVPHDDVWHLLNQWGEVFAWPGLGEAYGLVFLEAQSRGLAVVACRDRGVPDVVKDGETGLLSEPGDVDAYAANIQRMISEGGLRGDLRRAARRFVATERSIPAAAATLRAAFAEIVR